MDQHHRKAQKAELGRSRSHNVRYKTAISTKRSQSIPFLVPSPSLLLWPSSRRPGRNDNHEKVPDLARGYHINREGVVPPPRCNKSKTIRALLHKTDDRVLYNNLFYDKTPVVVLPCQSVGSSKFRMLGETAHGTMPLRFQSRASKSPFSSKRRSLPPLTPRRRPEPGSRISV